MGVFQCGTSIFNQMNRGIHIWSCHFFSQQGISLSGINDTAHLYGAIRQGLLRINATVLRSFRAIELTISSTAPGPLAVSVPQGTVFEGVRRATQERCGQLFVACSAVDFFASNFPPNVHSCLF